MKVYYVVEYSSTDIHRSSDVSMKSVIKARLEEICLRVGIVTP